MRQFIVQFSGRGLGMVIKFSQIIYFLSFSVEYVVLVVSGNNYCHFFKR